MYLVRDVLQCKPGHAKDLVAVFKKALPYLRKTGMKNPQIMTDMVATYWTVVLQAETENLQDFEEAMKRSRDIPEMGKIMEGYMEHLVGGRREVYVLH
jgi:hypothetical protein